MQEDEFLVWFVGSLISCWSPNLKVMPSICGSLYDILSLLPQRFDMFQSHLETGLVEDIKQWSYMKYLNQDKFQISIEHRNYGLKHKHVREIIMWNYALKCCLDSSDI